MALNIANPSVEEKAIKVSRLLGVNKTAAVSIALDYFLKNQRTESEDDVLQKDIAQLFDEMAALPIRDEREPDEILGYDENGLA